MGTTFRDNNGDILHMEHQTMQLSELMRTTNREARLPFWDIRYRQHYSDGIHVGHCTLNVHQDIKVNSGLDTPIPGLVFLQQGRITTTAHNSNTTHQFTPGQHSLLPNPYNPRESIFYQQKNLQFLVVSFVPERFLQLAENAGPALYKMANNMVNGRADSTLSNLPVTPEMQQTIREINACRFEGGLKDLFLQAKSIELLILQCEQFEKQNDTSPKKIKLSETDIRKIHAARECLLANIQHPPSLAQLARQTGLNEFKLKAGFKEVFNNTVFGYFKAYRLDIAYKLLKKGELPVTEVAYEAGYTTVQHFSNEFSKQYGVRPSLVD
ncbi:helix-turn-helix transcriptional regulator [Chitinophaga flava]|uniref:HTH araC/xylS-type domain-containing protein n=1 Tax=Chitinophaga flava TaxID=2259036 RepID=A0A365XT72_9BACT|nr:AraC family transcriptional regulator [Chitinophaga flava]RBL89576.1 hypothetical protein DF182_24010 [Chitinophaga flava]